MAPVPDDVPHYDGASPLDGGDNPVTLGGSDTKYSPSRLEIGVIVGVVSLAVVSLIWLFFWRSRRSCTSRETRASSATATLNHGQELTDAGGLRAPTPIHKDDRASSADNDESHSAERPPRYHLRPAANRSHWPYSSQINPGLYIFLCDSFGAILKANSHGIQCKNTRYQHASRGWLSKYNVASAPQRLLLTWLREIFTFRTKLVATDDLIWRLRKP
ncbi:hypothetical protein F4777DRAFT_593288 [Nemania sp. FL0916]|nr:hypothetical protein F4777DRAFT_593288 [Nemania sp. FL0916]